MSTRPALPYRAQNAKYPPSSATAGRSGNAPDGRAGRANAPTCLWCGQRLTLTSGHQRRLTCGPSCRSSLSRKKRAACVKAMCQQFGYNLNIARAVMARFGLPECERVMNALGWTWDARLKSFFQPYNEARRAA